MLPANRLSKPELRKVYLNRRAGLSAAVASELSDGIAKRFFREADLSAVATLHTFIPLLKFNEIDTSLIYRRIWDQMPQIVVAAPVVDKAAGELRHYRFARDVELVESKWGIQEPHNSEPIDPCSVDLVIVPLLAFDTRGHRVGYGKGYYDRFLSQCRPDCLKWGVSYFPPVEHIDGIGPHDQPLNGCLTPDNTLHFSCAR